MIGALMGLALLASFSTAMAGELRGTGDLGVVVERATGSLLIVDQSEHTAIGRIEGLGDLSHASVVFSPDERFAYVFGRDGGLTKVDILEQRIAARVLQAGNSIGGAISDDGTLVAVSNYEPGGVRVFDAGDGRRYPGGMGGWPVEDHRSGRCTGPALRFHAVGRG
jgi:protein NirF